MILMNLPKDFVFTKVNDIEDEVLDYLQKIVSTYEQNIWLTKIGSGAFGNVYKYTTDSGKTYAIKTSKKYNSTCTVKDAHDIEMGLLLQDIECIPTLYAYVEFPDSFIMIVDYVDGLRFGDFREHPYRDSSFYITRSSIENFENCIDKMKAMNIIMGDLHDYNIMLDKQGKIMIVDIGGFYTKINEYDENECEGFYKVRDIKRFYNNRIKQDSELLLAV